MHIEVISTGDEIVTGLVVDTNAAWLSALLLERGWQVRRRHTVGDEMNDLIAVLSDAASRSDVVIVCGGLGPTTDDLTADAAARAFAAPLELRSDWLENIRERFARRGRPMSPSNEKQAWLPRDSVLLDNPVGTACGFMVTQGACRLFFTPGVPFEFRQMVEEQILPRLQDDSGIQTRLRRFYTFGLPESTLGDRLSPLPWPQGIVVGYRSSMPLIELKLIGHGVTDADMEQAEALLLAQVQEVLVGCGDTPPWQSILSRLAGTPLYVQECASGGALQRLCRDYPQLTARFESQLPAEPGALQAESCGVTLVVGAEQDDAVALLLHINGQRFEQKVQVRHPDRASRERILAFCALDMLRRHLDGLSPFGEYQTLRRLESRLR